MNEYNLKMAKILERDELPYFDGVKPYRYNGEVKSPFFVFAEDVTFKVIKPKFSIYKYILNIFKLKFNPRLAYVGEFVEKEFLGVGESPSSDKNLDEDLNDENVLEYLIKREGKHPKVWIASKSKNPEYDFVLGRVDDNREVVKSETYMCKKLSKDQKFPRVIRGLEVDVTCQKVHVTSAYDDDLKKLLEG